MITEYARYKEQVLSIYSTFCSVVKDVKGEKETPYDKRLEFLQKRYENIVQDKFLLMVAGEAKSGKSTFINAYLGKEILPMDVKQCTSAIIKVRYGEKYTLTATYVDGRRETLDDEESIKNFLTVNAAINEEYRDIPVNFINMELIAVEKSRVITDEKIKRWTEQLKGENIHKLPDDEYAAKIKQYIRETQPHWMDIVQDIEICYPFEDEDVRGIEIVDTPGVNARGQLGRITDNYMDNANAVMFLKPLGGGHVLEANSFREFLESRSADRIKGAKFLILTRYTEIEKEEDKKRLYEEAVKQNPDIDRKQIIAVDSKTELYWNMFQTMTTEEIENYIIQEAGAGRLFHPLSTAWFVSSRRNRTKFLEALKELSHFNAVDDALNLFAHKAQYIALSEFLKYILEVLETIAPTLTEEIANRKLKISDPIELQNKINNAKRELASLERKIKFTVDQIFEKYTGLDGIISQETDDAVREYVEQLNEINPSSSDSLDQLEKCSFRKLDELKLFEEDIQKSVVDECDKRLIEYSQDITIDYKTFRPSLTKEEFESIKETVREANTRRKEIETGSTFNKRKETVTIFDQPHFFQAFKNNILMRIKSIQLDVQNDMIDFVRAVTNKYSTKLSSNLKLIQADYDALREEEKTTKEQLAIIQHLEDNLAQVTNLTTKVNEQKEGVDSHVK